MGGSFSFLSARIAEISPPQGLVLPLHQQNRNARVIQWIGCWPTKPDMEVRILPGAQEKRSFGRLSVCAGLKTDDKPSAMELAPIAEVRRRKRAKLLIPRTWFNSTRLHKHGDGGRAVQAQDCGSCSHGFESHLSHPMGI